MASPDDVKAAIAAGWPLSEDTIKANAGASLDDAIRAANRRVEAAVIEAGRAPTGSRRHLEEDMQRKVIKWARENEDLHPDLWLLHHCPNGGARSKGEAGKMKGLGAMAGIPDLFLPVPRGVYHGAYWELKAGKNTPDKQQKKVIAALRKAGYRVVVMWDDPEPVQADIIAYLYQKVETTK